MDATFLPRAAVQRWFWLALFGIVAVVSVSYTLKAMKNRSAFLRWRDQVRQLDGATDIYQSYQYPNPPIMAMLLRPLAEVEPPLAGALAWFAIKIVLAALSLAAIFGMIEHDGPAFPVWAKGLTIALSLRPLVGDLSHGNVNILILFLMTAALYAFHRRCDLLCGLLLALAICCKVTPLLFVPYFLWKRQWKVLAGCVAGMGLFLLVVPGVYLGWDDNLARLQSWANQMVMPFLRDGIVSSEHPNQSLPGVVHRLLTHSPSFSAYPEGVYTPTEYHNLANVGRQGARWLIRLAQGLFVLGLVLLCRSRQRGGWRLSCEFAFVLVGMLIFSERTWKHHCVTLALPFGVLSYAIATQPINRVVRIAIGAALALAVTLMFSASGILPTRAADLAQVYGVYLWAFLILLASLAGLLFCARHGDNRSLIHWPFTSR